jgi:molybdenum cofactor biosynthesis protein B
MSATDHRAFGPGRVSCHILTISDTRTAATDKSGLGIAELLEDEGHIVSGRSILPDEPTQVCAHVKELLCDPDVPAIITSGGTGVSRRDSTYEAVVGLFEKEITGFGELFRMLSFEEIGAAAMLSRATAGIAARHVIFILPGSEHAVRLAMSRLIIPELGHIVGELNK